jgi:3-oxoacyl-[acyl-carrier-protein] synthase III
MAGDRGFATEGLLTETRSLKLAALAVATPPHHLDNDNLLAILGRMSLGDDAVEDVRDTFRRCGSERRFLDLPHRGYALDLVRRACAEALARADVPARDVDLLIYCSVARGWLEPSTAAAVQAAIGASAASCFDVAEACAGWVRALELADALLRTGKYRTALVVGVEAGMQRYVLPPERVESVAPEHRAGYTIGEAATATVLTADGEPFHSELRSVGELFDVCMIPLANADAFFPDDTRSLPTVDRFTSLSERLFTRVISELVEMMRERIRRPPLDDVALFVPHGASARASEVVRRALDVSTATWFCGHHHFGNAVDMAMPAALARAIELGRLRRGQRVCFLVGSAGISVGFGSLVY